MLAVFVQFVCKFFSKYVGSWIKPMKKLVFFSSKVCFFALRFVFSR